MAKENIIQIRSFAFSLQIIRLYQKLQSEKEFAISNQLIRSGTGIGANVEEAIGGYSRNDFSFKLSIALKEARETKYWLKLLHHSDLTSTDVTSYIKESDELVRILTAIIKTCNTKNNP